MEGARIGPYRVLGDLGSGGMGKVYLAEVEGKAPGLEDGTRVALKVIHPHLLETPGFFKRFLREAEIGKSVQQDNVVRCFDCDALMVEGQQQNFLVMEYVEGQTLRDLLAELERVPEELCRHIGLEVAKGLQAIHEAGVVHRDLKPENVLITPEHVVKVMDLGVARLQDEAIRLSQAGAFVGSLEYAAPEQFKSADEEPDGRADLHSLGVLLYELATGQHPYRDEDASKVLRNILDTAPRKAGEVNPQLSPFYEEVVADLLAKDPGDRFADAGSLAQVLEQGEQSDWWKERAKALRIETKRPLRRIRIPRETALYGRDDDLAKLHDLYETAKAGDGQVLLVEGEAGIGKTRLVDEFVGRLRQGGEDINFLFGSYPPGGAATAAGAFSTAYREHFGEEGLEDTLKEYVKPTPILIPAFAALLKGETTPKDAEPLTKDSLQTVFVHATRGLAAERTTIVLIDDLHFAPEDGRALFTSLALAVPDHRILLIGTMRPGVSEEWTAGITRLEQAEQRSLSRLGLKDFSALLKDAFRSERLALELAGKIGEKSDGNPFFAFEIIRGLREGQFIAQQEDGTWVTTKVIQDIQVPSSVLDLVNARVADLDEAQRELLDVASCCGFEFDGTLVADVLGEKRIPIFRRLGHIEKKHRLVRAAGRHHVFDHHQVQEALYGGLSEVLKEEYHAAIAEALETRAGAAEVDPKDLDGALCVDLCEHSLKGVQGERALRYLDAALDHLEAGYLNDQAITLADRALGASGLLKGKRRYEILLHKNTRLSLLGHVVAQEKVLTEARALAEASRDVSQLATVEGSMGALLWRLGRHGEARAHFEAGLAVAREVGDRQIEARLVGGPGLVSLELGRYEEARAHFEQSIAIAREIGARADEAGATVNLGNVYLRQSRYEEAGVLYERGLAICLEIGHRQFGANAIGNLGIVSQNLGRLQAARSQFEQHLSIAREIGDRMSEAHANGSLGVLCLNLGQYKEARARLQQQAAIAREMGSPRLEGTATGNLGLVSNSVGRYEEARAYYEESLATCREIGNREGESIRLCNLGELWLALGDHVRARSALMESVGIARDLNSRWIEGAALAAFATLAHEAEERAQALDLLARALALRREIGRVSGVVASLVQLGAFHWQARDHEAARAALSEAIDLLRDQNRKPDLAHALALLANLPGGDAAEAEAALQEAGDAGNTPETRYYLWKATGKPEHLAEVKHLLDYRVEHAPEEYRESMLKNVRLHREIMEAWEEHGGEGE